MSHDLAGVRAAGNVIVWLAAGSPLATEVNTDIA